MVKDIRKNMDNDGNRKKFTSTEKYLIKKIEARVKGDVPVAKDGEVYKIRQGNIPKGKLFY